MAQQIAKRILLRLPPDEAAAIEAIAERERCSLNEALLGCIRRCHIEERDAQSAPGPIKRVKVDYTEVKECVKAAIEELRLQGQFRELAERC